MSAMFRPAAITLISISLIFLISALPLACAGPRASQCAKPAPPGPSCRPRNGHLSEPPAWMAARSFVSAHTRIAIGVSPAAWVHRSATFSGQADDGDSSRPAQGLCAGALNDARAGLAAQVSQIVDCRKTQRTQAGVEPVARQFDIRCAITTRGEMFGYRHELYEEQCDDGTFRCTAFAWVDAAENPGP